MQVLECGGREPSDATAKPQFVQSYAWADVPAAGALQVLQKCLPQSAV